MNTIHVQLFANIREKAGVSAIQLELKEDATVDDVLVAIKQLYPQLVPHLTEKIVISINQKIALRSTRLSPGAELTLMPPVGGGCY